MSLSTSFTQGGQTTLHKIRMMKQIIASTLAICLFLSGGWLCYRTLHTFPDPQRGYVLSYYWARLNLLLSGTNTNIKQPFKEANGKESQIDSYKITQHPSILLAVSKFWEHLLSCALESLLIFIGLFVGISYFWVRQGQFQRRKKRLSGMDLIDNQDLVTLLKKKQMNSDMTLAGVPLVRGSETGHILLTGTTGVGKSNAFYELLNQIRAKSQRVLIVDMNGDYVSRYYRPGQDILLNPLDARSAPWSLWAECHESYHYQDFAASLVPDESHDPFWTRSARLLLSTGAQRLAESQNHQELAAILTSKPLYQIQDVFKGTPAAILVDKDGERTVVSIRAHLAPFMDSLVLCEETTKPFSIRKWIQEENPSDEWVFLTCLPEQRELMRPLLSAWSNTALSAMMGRLPDTIHRLYYVFDELPSLNKLSALGTGLAELRKYGGCIIAGIQDMGQIRKRYGPHEAQSMMSLMNTKVLFRATDPDSAKWISACMGEQEMVESNEGISFGAHQIRDGVSITENKRLRPTVSATDIINLDNLEAYLKLAGNLPITKVKFPYTHTPSIEPGFVKKQPGE